MSKYINADDMNDILMGAANDIQSKMPAQANLIKMIAAKLSLMPSADVVEVKHGEWERIVNSTNVHFRCSVCHRYRFHNGEMLRKYKFCPHCGANMRGETDEA